MDQDRLVSAADLATQKDIVERLNLNPQLVANITGRKRGRTGFPAPICGRGNRGIWLWSEVKAWYDLEQPKTIEARKAAAKTSRLAGRRSPAFSQTSKKAA